MSILPSWAPLAIGGVLVAAIGFQQLRIADLKTDVADQKALVSSREGTIKELGAAADKARAEWEAERASLMALHAANSQKAVDDFQTKRQADQRAAAELRADNQRLRNNVLRHAAITRTPGESDTALAGRAADRLAGCGVLLSEGVDLAEEGRRLLKQRDAEVKLLKDQIAVDRQACSVAPETAGSLQ